MMMTSNSNPGVGRRDLILSLVAAGAWRGAAAATMPPPNGYLNGGDFAPFQGPSGTFQMSVLWDSQIYPGFFHWWGVYQPASAFTGSGKPALMVFQDGSMFVNPGGPWRTRWVLDNLIAQRAIPPMVAVFIAPGRPLGATQPGFMTAERSLEYDSLSPRYSQFLLNEILPRARALATWTDDPAMHGIGGHSSGGSCAFTVAWLRPDLFRKVYSANGSFTNIRGADVYPSLVLKSPRRPIRVYQWSDVNDMRNRQYGDWASANRAMAAALQTAGYDHRFDFGAGTHNPAFAAAHFADALKWLWRA